MANRPVDRRVRRTKRQLKLALLELIQEREYDAITIEEITERADIGRSTFYSHFNSKDELLFDGFAEGFIALAKASGTGEGRWLRFSLPMLEHMSTQTRFFRTTILHGARGKIRLRVLKALSQIILAEIDSGSGPAVEPWAAGAASEGLAHGLAGAFLGLATWWFEDATTLSASDVDELYQNIARCALHDAGAAG